MLLRGEDLRDALLLAAAQRLAPSARAAVGGDRAAARRGRRAARRRSRCARAPRQIGTLLAARRPPEAPLRRVAGARRPALEALLAAALERDELLGDVVETRALRRSDVLKTALLRAVEPRPAHAADRDHRRRRAAGRPRDVERRGPARARRAASRRRPQRLSRLIDEPARPLAPGGGRRRAAARVVLASTRSSRRRSTSFAPPDGVHVLDPGTSCRSCGPTPPSSSARSRTCSRTPRRHSGGHPVSVRARAVGERRRSSGSSTAGPGSRRRSSSASSSRSTARAPSEPAIAARASGSRSRAGFVEVNGGKVWAESLPGPGDDVRRRAAARWQPRAGAARRRSRVTRPRVLVCDDEPQILRALRVVLRDAGFDVVPASTAAGGARPRGAASRPTRRSSTSCCPTATGSR